MIFLNGQITSRLSGPSCPLLVQWHPYPLVPHGLYVPQPSIPTLQYPGSPSAQHPYPPVPMLSLSPASLSSSLPCSPSAHHPYHLVPNTFFQPSISRSAVRFLVDSLSTASLPSSTHAFPQSSIPILQSPMLPLSPASLPFCPSCLSSAMHPCSPVPFVLLQPSIPTL